MVDRKNVEDISQSVREKLEAEIDFSQLLKRKDVKVEPFQVNDEYHINEVILYGEDLTGYLSLCNKSECIGVEIKEGEIPPHLPIGKLKEEFLNRIQTKIEVALLSGELDKSEKTKPKS